jgi:hypothetical protein
MVLPSPFLREPGSSMDCPKCGSPLVFPSGSGAFSPNNQIGKLCSFEGPNFDGFSSIEGLSTFLLTNIYINDYIDQS